MTTKFYLSNASPASSPTSGEHSTTLPVGTSNTSANFSSWKSLVASGQTAGTISVTGLTQTTQQSTALAGFCTGAVSAGTYGLGTWTIALGKLVEANASANAFARVVIYFWNPSGSSVRGFVYDGTTDLGTEWPTTAAGQVLTVVGVAVTASAGDLLCVEVWEVATQAMNGPYTFGFDYGGGTDVTAGSTTATGSYVQAPADIPVAVQYTQAVSATATGTASVVRQIGVVKSFTAAGTASVVRQVALTKTVTATGTATLVASRLYMQALSAVATGAATVQRSVGLVRSATATGTATVARSIGKTVTATATGTASVVRSLSKTIAASATGTASVARSIGVVLAAAVATGSTTVRRSINLTATATATATATVQRSISLTLSTAATATASLLSTVLSIVVTVAATSVDTVRRLVTSTDTKAAVAASSDTANEPGSSDPTATHP